MHSPAKDRSSPDCVEALSELIQGYWKPVYYFVRRSGRRVEDAKDLTQEFFTVLHEKEYLRKVDPEHWKFRTFLIVVLKRFLSDQRDRERAKKRGGDRFRVPMDFAQAEAAFGFSESEEPDAAFRKDWARTVFDSALARLRADLHDSGKEKWYEVFRRFYGLSGGAESQRYGEIAAELGVTETDVTNYLHRTRGRFREIVVEELRHGLARKEDVEPELQELFESI